MLEEIKAAHEAIKEKYHTAQNLSNEIVASLKEVAATFSKAMRVEYFAGTHTFTVGTSSYRGGGVAIRVWVSDNDVWLQVGPKPKIEQIVTNMYQVNTILSPIIAYQLFSRGFYNWK